ncbi:hypothetical protein TNCV_4742481 [Trichonephila clavipes]|nr:hypothetical protein TNCV_4742481 [Trichonephila clavipes]
MNETTQRRKQLNSAERTSARQQERKQLNSSVGTKQLNSALPSTAYNRLQPPTTACRHFTAESAFSTYCRATFSPMNNLVILIALLYELIVVYKCKLSKYKKRNGHL